MAYFAGIALLWQMVHSAPAGLHLTFRVLFSLVPFNCHSYSCFVHSFHESEPNVNLKKTRFNSETGYPPCAPAVPR
uniref:Putative secreted peptide n=1 Tax=Anopheles braziliensis TaxID=58242 RepID=A0A2M3ZUN3_9DIPT